MGFMTFKGGIHPVDGKELSKDKPIRELLPKGELIYPLSQHIGAPAKPIVTVGDEVLRGQKIAEADGFVSAPVYASVSGIIRAIEPRRVAIGDMVNAIVIESDGKMKEVVYKQSEDVAALSREEIIDKIKEAGIVGMGGAGFPTHVKLSPKEPDKIEYVIANCAECESYLTSDYRIMLERTQKLVGGMKIALQLFPNAKGIFAVEDNKPDCITKLNKLTEQESRMEVISLETKYPQGGERQLIYAVTKRELNAKMLPADVGCVVNNVESLVEVYNAVVLGRPLMNHIVTVSGDAVAEPQNYDVCIGTSHAELLEASGGLTGECQKMISGGPMMGFALFDMHVPVTKTTSAFLCFTEDEVSASETIACIHCGRCVDACPERLVPAKLADFANHGQKDAYEKWHGLECVECGSCSYICPSKRPLTQTVKAMKRQILADKRKK